MAFQKRSVERRSAKRACSSIRYTLVETFLAWLHHPDTAKTISLQARSLIHASTVTFWTCFGIPPTTLVATVRLSRSEKRLRNLNAIPSRRRIGSSRVSRALPQRVVKIFTPKRMSWSVPCFLPCWMAPSGASSYDCVRKQWRPFYSLVLRIQRFTFSCHKERLSNPDLVGVDRLTSTLGFPFVSFLIEPVVESESVHSFLILCALIRAERKLLLEVVSSGLTHPHTVTQTLNEPLTRWPLYEEDMDLVVLTLELLDMILSVQTLRKTLAVDAIDLSFVSCVIHRALQLNRFMT
ncbi:hypothetical protein PsorP6_003626 [Peronosclerospora sorghi]|uniref:Uncharacterized protein n=1 Tax=Peronosclerospora sorghi TaxID=230839 RepID=A0ACC0VPJ0_9STRA|nr:hypothetical protein PsorP6_003626 [Peronosclerospora sorghi]